MFASPSETVPVHHGISNQIGIRSNQRISAVETEGRVGIFASLAEPMQCRKYPHRTQCHMHYKLKRTGLRAQSHKSKQRDAYFVSAETVCLEMDPFTKQHESP